MFRNYQHTLDSNTEDLSPKSITSGQFKLLSLFGLYIRTHCFWSYKKDNCYLKLSDATILFAHMLDNRSMIYQYFEFDYAISMILEDYPIEDQLFGDKYISRISYSLATSVDAFKYKWSEFIFIFLPLCWLIDRAWCFPCMIDIFIYFSCKNIES